MDRDVTEQNVLGNGTYFSTKRRRQRSVLHVGGSGSALEYEFRVCLVVNGRTDVERPLRAVYNVQITPRRNSPQTRFEIRWPVHISLLMVQPHHYGGSVLVDEILHIGGTALLTASATLHDAALAQLPLALARPRRKQM